MGVVPGAARPTRSNCTRMTKGRTAWKPPLPVDLGITLGTFKTHVRHIYEKMGVHTREELRALVSLAGE